MSGPLQVKEKKGGIMYQNVTLPFDAAHPLQVAKQGTFERWVEVDGKRRRYLVHIPHGCREAAAGIFILPPDGWTADNLLNKTHWRWLAEAEPERSRPILFFLEPQNGIWHTEEAYGCADGDVAYVEAIFHELSDRHWFNVHESSLYLYGCEEGAAIAQMSAMWNPAVYAGLCTIDAEVSDDYVQKAAQDACVNLDGFEDTTHRCGVLKSDVPLPVWMISDRTQSPEALRFWKHSICADHCVQLSGDTVAHRRTAAVPHPHNNEIAAYEVWESSLPGCAQQAGDSMLHRIWNSFLSRHRRWMGDAGGNLRMYADPLCDRHVEYHIEKIDGWLREWYTYVPECVRQQPGKPVPLVFACHGYTCNGAIYMEHSGWNRVAEENGFIVVYPTAGYGQMCTENAYCSSDNLPLPAWNIFHKDTQPEEYPFFRYLIDRTAADYPVDRTRIFATGHSLGSLMVQMLGLAMPECFAAIAPCSGILFSDLEQEPLSLPEVAARRDTLLPIWMFGGSEEAFLVPDRPVDGNRTAYSLEAWLRLNQMEPVSDWADGWHLHEDRWDDLIYRKNGMPLVGFTRVQDMPHATTEEMSRRIWNEFFSHFSRINGELVYRQNEV